MEAARMGLQISVRLTMKCERGQRQGGLVREMVKIRMDRRDQRGR